MGKVSSKAYVFTVLGTLVVVLATCVTINAVVDPLQYFRKAEFYTPYFSLRQRYQNPGLARNYEHRVIVAGTSTSENFYPSEVERRFEGPAVKLSVSGGTGYEQRLSVEIALGVGDVKRVIWLLDYFAFCHNPDEVSPDIGEFPYFLYEEPSIQLYKYLLSISTLKSSVVAILRSLANRPRDVDTLNAWDQKSVYGCEPVVARFLDPETVREGKRRVVDDHVIYTAETIRANIEANVLSLVGAHPDVEFEFVLPPYSGLRNTWTKTNLPQDHDAQIYFRELLFEHVRRLPNVRIHDFQLDPQIVMDLENYKDMAHFSKKISDAILSAILRGDHLVRPGASQARLDSVLMAADANTCGSL